VVGRGWLCRLGASEFASDVSECIGTVAPGIPEAHKFVVDLPNHGSGG